MIIETDEKTFDANRLLPQLPSLLNRFFDQFLQLLRTQFTLFKTELKEEVRSYTTQFMLTAVAAIVALVGFVFLNIGLVLWLNHYFNNLALSFASVGGVHLIIGAMSTRAFARKMTSQPPVLKETVEELEKNKEWIKRETQ